MLPPKLPVINNQKLFEQALTHRSYANESLSKTDNERLEFLGDAVLSFLIAESLYQRYSELDEAGLTKLRAMLVDQKQLAHLAQEMELGKLIRIGKGAEKTAVRNSPAVLSDTFEAVIGAYFLAQGITAVKEYIESLFIPLADEILSSKASDKQTYLNDVKNLLQQWAIVNMGQNPIYQLVTETGPPHEKTFTIQVQIKGTVYGVGQGSRKQDAEKKAALIALKSLSII